jgi:hypothetical protein
VYSTKFTPGSSVVFLPKSASAPSLPPGDSYLVPGQQTQFGSSPFSLYPELAYFDRDPPEFAFQQKLEAQRQAKKILRTTYRDSIESVEPNAFQPRAEYPPRINVPVKQHRLNVEGGGGGGSTWEQAPLPRMVYSRQPVPILPNYLAGVGEAATGSTSLSPTLQKTEGGEVQRRREESLRLMRHFARMPHGAPYTFSQVHREVEAKTHFREARDQRALVGSFAPDELGPGTGRTRRKLIFAKDFQRPGSSGASASVDASAGASVDASAPRPGEGAFQAARSRCSPEWSPSGPPQLALTDD